MLESNSLKKLVDQELPFLPTKKCLHGIVICQKCDIVESVPAKTDYNEKLY